MARTKRITIAISDDEHKQLSKMARNSYAVYLSTFIYRVIQDILQGKIKIK